MESAISVGDTLINTNYIVHITRWKAREGKFRDGPIRTLYHIALAFHPPGEEIKVEEGQPGFEQVDIYFKWHSKLALDPNIRPEDKFLPG